MLSKRLKRYIAVLVFLVFAIYFYFNIESFKPLLDIDVWLLIIVVLLNIGIIYSNGIFTQLIMRPFNKYISKSESFYVSLISSVGNFFAPAGAGFGFRAFYLKKKHDFPYGPYVSTLAGNYLIVFLINSMLGLIALVYLNSYSSVIYWILVAVFSLIFITCLVFSIVKVPTLNTKAHNQLVVRFFKNLQSVTNGWNHIISHKDLLVQLAGLTLVNFFIAMAIFFVIIQSLHFHTNLAALMLFAALGSMSILINITPANIGVKEAIYLFSSTVLGFSVSQLLSIALIERGVLFITLLALWLSSSKIRKSAKAVPA